MVLAQQRIYSSVGHRASAFIESQSWAPHDRCAANGCIGSGRLPARATVYILAGAFVGFLIERYGPGQFRSLYQSENYAEVYGKPLAVLEGESRASLNR